MIWVLCDGGNEAATHRPVSSFAFFDVSASVGLPRLQRKGCPEKMVTVGECRNGFNVPSEHGKIRNFNLLTLTWEV